MAAERIDVLADVIAAIESEGIVERFPVSADAVRNYRAAVAELIERDARVLAVLETWESAVADFKGQSVAKGMMALCAKELRAALARIGGAS